jgi:hypothetical protein
MLETFFLGSISSILALSSMWKLFPELGIKP